MKKLIYFAVLCVGLFGITSFDSDAARFMPETIESVPYFENVDTLIHQKNSLVQDFYYSTDSTQIITLDAWGYPIEYNYNPSNTDESSTMPFSITEIPHSFTGYTTKEQYGSSKNIMISSSVNHPYLQPNTVYISQKYRYIATISVPHGNTIIVQPSNTYSANSQMGNDPTNESRTGFSAELVSESSSGDIYNLVTIISEINYSASGVHLPQTVYLPFRIQNVNNLYYQYYVSNIFWD